MIVLLLTCHSLKATASYRLLPHIVIHEPIPEPDCEKFQACFSPGVIDIVTTPSGAKTCVVKNPRNDSVSREVLRHPEFEGKVTLGRVRDHFICKSVKKKIMYIRPVS
jgi:DNA-directed RNA polymerase I and III subunit RPAC1